MTVKHECLHVKTTLILPFRVGSHLSVLHGKQQMYSCRYLLIFGFHDVHTHIGTWNVSCTIGSPEPAKVTAVLREVSVTIGSLAINDNKSEHSLCYGNMQLYIQQIHKLIHKMHIESPAWY